MLGGTYAWTQTQYFVGADGSRTAVAIFQGVNTEFGPLRFFSVYRTTDLKLGDLNPSTRSQVRSGITAGSEGDAEQIVTRLRGNRLPLCHPVSSTPTPTVSGSGAATGGALRLRQPRAAERDQLAAGGELDHPPRLDHPRRAAPQHPARRRADRHPDRRSDDRRCPRDRLLGGGLGEHAGRVPVDPATVRPAHRAAAEADPGGDVPPMTSLIPITRVPTRRNVELLLLVFAVLIVVAAEMSVEAARDGRLAPSRLLAYAAVPLVAGGLTHLVIRKVAKYADPLMLPLVVLLNGLGLVMIHRLDLGRQRQSPGDSAAQAPTQVVWTALGVLLFVGILLVIRDHRTLQRYAYTLAFIGLFFLMLPAVLPASLSEVNGARIWIRVAGFSIQPGEFAKILLTIFGAAYLVQKRDVLALAGRRFLGLDLPRGRDFGPLLVAWLLGIGVLVRGHDLGTSLLFFGLFVVLMYVATERVSWIIIGVLLFAGGAYLAFQLFGTVQTRVDLWLHLFDYNPYGVALQQQQSLFGLGTGGIFGTGLGAGHPELVPLAEHRLHHLLLRGGARAVRAHRPADALRAAGGPWLRRRPRGAGLVRQAAGLRAGVPVRAAGLRRGRRRHPAAAGDRSHRAVPVLRRIVAAGQLDDPRPAHAGLGRRPAACDDAHPEGARGRGGGGVNKPMRSVAVVIALLFVALFVNLNVVQVVRGSDYRNDPNNQRALLNEYSSPRGSIVIGKDRYTLARSKSTTTS